MDWRDDSRSDYPKLLATNRQTARACLLLDAGWACISTSAVMSYLHIFCANAFGDALHSVCAGIRRCSRLVSECVLATRPQDVNAVIQPHTARVHTSSDNTPNCKMAVACQTIAGTL